VAERQLAHLVRLVDDLLDVSRIATGKIRLQRRPVRLADIVASAVEAAEPGIVRARHQLVLQPGADEVWLDGDAERLTQVLTNLLNNASRYSAPGGQIRVSDEATADTVVICVRDTGIGLHAEDRERIFEMFAQGRDTGGGLGIGLALAKTIVDMHGGSVEARSEGPGHGSEFRVSLPRAAAPAVAEAAARERAAPRGLRIVVADDNQDSAEMMRALLELDGHVVRVANDGVAAFDLVSSFDPSVAVLDIGMPRLDGYEVARRVRAQGRPVRLIAVTGWGQDADRQRAEAAGFDAHLTKPASPDELRRLLEGLGRS
jgi:CheY-like chemotaxis protein/anti-sigma regulatory factor (Ser/Thr protein kinase)